MSRARCRRRPAPRIFRPAGSSPSSCRLSVSPERRSPRRRRTGTARAWSTAGSSSATPISWTAEQIVGLHPGRLPVSIQNRVMPDHRDRCGGDRRPERSWRSFKVDFHRELRFRGAAMFAVRAARSLIRLARHLIALALSPLRRRATEALAECACERLRANRIPLPSATCSTGNAGLRAQGAAPRPPAAAGARESPSGSPSQAWNSRWKWKAEKCATAAREARSSFLSRWRSMCSITACIRRSYSDRLRRGVANARYQRPR